MSGLSRGKYVGIDLALPGRRRIGIALLDARLGLYHTWLVDDGVVQFVDRLRPSLICIDAPLGLPIRGYNRLVEVRAREIGLKLLPPLLGAMAKLTKYGIEIARELMAKDYVVVEVHPSSTLKLLGLSIEEFLNRLRFRGSRALSRHEADSLVAAYTCYLRDMGCTEEIHGLEGEGYLVVPSGSCGSP